MGNSGASKIVGVGDIFLETSIENKLVLKDVRHVPNICLNLISTSKLDDEGFTNFFGESKWKLTKGSLVAARGKKLNTLYVMEAKLHKGEINAVQKYASIDIWPRRLGHINEKRPQVLARKQFLPNLQVDLINLSLSLPLKCDIPERLWTRKDISYDHLRVFGCKAFVHVPKYERFKLDLKAKLCIFLGKDVVFLGDQLLDDIDKVEKPKSSINIPFTVDLIPLPVVQDDHEIVEQEAHKEHGENVSNEAPTIDDVELTESVKQATPSPPIEISFRRSIKERQPSTRYPPIEYVMLSGR
ncbi:hypothetical protein AAG906_028364 [Vitis piasezkii]